MRNIKLDQQLDSSEYWPTIAMVNVPGSATAAEIPEGTQQPQLETIIQSWRDIAVLQTTPGIEVYFGYIINGRAEFLNVPVETQEGRFGVHLGHNDVTFFVFAQDLHSRPTLQLVEVAHIDNMQYSQLPLY